MKTYKKATKDKVLAFSAAHGPVAAEREFGVSRDTIRRWNDAAGTYIPQVACYPDEYRRRVLEHAKEHGKQSAVKAFGVSPASIDNWNAEMKIIPPTQRDFTDDEKIAYLKHAKIHGIITTAELYDIAPSRLNAWNKIFRIYEAQRSYDEELIMFALHYAKEYGVARAQRDLMIPRETLQRWNRKRNVYAPRAATIPGAYSDDEKQSLLKVAKEIYDSLPDGLRSVNQAFKELARHEDVTSDQLYAWNKRFKILTPRKKKERAFTDAEIAYIQEAFNELRGIVARTARHVGISARLLQKLVTSGRIRYQKPTLETKPRQVPGPKKKQALANLMQILTQIKTK